MNPLTDTFNRRHTYLRISLTERCNLRCTYCMPAQGIQLSPKEHLMTADEIFGIAKIFTDLGVNKIRLTGGEPTVRKDFKSILSQLNQLKVPLFLTTNGIGLQHYITNLKAANISTINLSLDTLDPIKFQKITRRNYFQEVWDNLYSLIKHGFRVKINCVLVKGLNETEIIDFIELTKELDISVRFIEFMPFDGNLWKKDQTVSYQEVLAITKKHYGDKNVNRLTDAAHDTAKNHKINDYLGSFAVISSVTNPFCDSCNRLRLTADGKLKNCLFSDSETDLLTPYRNKQDLVPIIQKALQAKKKIRSGMETLESLNSNNNRSMIKIGG